MNLSIESFGTGPALVMLHGWAMHSGLFAPLSARLAESFTLHLVDMPGHGYSRDSVIPLRLDAIADAVIEQVPTALWLGWSLGGLASLLAAQQRAASVRGLIMLCANPRFVKSEDWPQGMPSAIFEGFARDLQSDYRATLDRFLMLEAQGSDRMREELRLLRDQVFARGEPPTQSLCDGLQLLQETDLLAGLSSLSMPSLWISGRRDRLVSPVSMRAAAERSPRSHYVEIAHGGHAPFLTHADEVAREIGEFVEWEHLA